MAKVNVFRRLVQAMLQRQADRLVASCCQSCRSVGLWQEFELERFWFPCRYDGARYAPPHRLCIHCWLLADVRLAGHLGWHAVDASITTLHMIVWLVFSFNGHSLAIVGSSFWLNSLITIRWSPGDHRWSTFPGWKYAHPKYVLRGRPLWEV